MKTFRVDNKAAHKLALLRDDIQLSILAILSVFFCLATVALVGSDLLYGKYHLNSLLCRDGIHGGE